MKSYSSHVRSVTTSLVVAGLLLIVAPGIAYGEQSDEKVDRERSVDGQVVDLEEMMRVDDTDDERRSSADDEAGPIPSVVPFDDQPRPHWMFVIGRNAVWGGMIGGLVGVGAYLVAGMEPSPWVISRFAGGGILVGAASGLVEAFLWSNGFIAGTPDSVGWAGFDIPKTYEVRVMEVVF